MKPIKFVKFRSSLFFTLSLLVITLSIRAQGGFGCGTVIDSAYFKKLQAVQSKKYISANINNCLNKTLSVYVHIVLDSSGNSNMQLSDLHKSVAALNKAFEPICLSFKICKIDSIRNWKYDNFIDKIHEPELVTLHYTPKVINWFFVEKIVQPSNANGYAYLPGGNDLIMLQKKSLLEQPIFKTIIHETGHFFGLVHTHETKFGIEYANHSNCATTGDLICDTEGDPFPQGTVNQSNCVHTGTKDPLGNWYVPPSDNYMSYWPDKCACRFTTGQYNFMLNAYLTSRDYLW